MSAATVSAPRRGPTRELLTLAAPMVLMMVSRMAMSFIDFIMVSQLGTEAQAAIGPAATFAFVFACVGMGVAGAVQTFVSQADGRGRPRDAGSYAWQSVYIAGVMLLVSAPLSLTCSTWFGWIADLGQHPPVVREMEIAYLSVAVLLLAPGTLAAGFQGFFNGIQKPRVALDAVLISTAVNAVGNWVLIYGYVGIPQWSVGGVALGVHVPALELGIEGAGIATVIGWSVRALYMGLAMLRPAYDQLYATRGTDRPDLEKLRGLIRVGAPTSVQWLVDIGSWLVFQTIIIAPLGAAVMAATNVSIQYMHLAFMPAIGLGMALTSQVGYAIGARDPDNAQQRVTVALRVTLVYILLIALLLLFLPAPLIRLFNTTPEVVDAGGIILFWMVLFLLFDALAIVHMAALRGAGDTRVPAMIMGVCSWSFQVFGALLMVKLAPQFGLNGPWSMCTLYITLLGASLTWRWRSGAWRSIKLFRDEQAIPEPTPHEPVAAEAYATDVALTADIGPEAVHPAPPEDARA